MESGKRVQGKTRGNAEEVIGLGTVFQSNSHYMLPQCVLAFLLLATAFYAANAKERALSSSDIAAIRRICRQVVGYPVANDYNLFSQLTPFLRSKSELEHLIVNCSSQHCSGSIHLRDQAEVLRKRPARVVQGSASAPLTLSKKI